MSTRGHILSTVGQVMGNCDDYVWASCSCGRGWQSSGHPDLVREDFDAHVTNSRKPDEDRKRRLLVSHELEAVAADLRLSPGSGNEAMIELLEAAAEIIEATT